MVVSHGLDAETLRRCLLMPMPSVEAALDAALKTHGNGAKITIIPEGPYVTPVAMNGSNGAH
jgi:nickel-dependent lactate racemase